MYGYETTNVGRHVIDLFVDLVYIICTNICIFILFTYTLFLNVATCNVLCLKALYDFFFSLLNSVKYIICVDLI